MAAYDKRLRGFQRQMDGPDAVRVRERLSKPIMDMKHDLIWLQKRVKSLKPVIRSLISERFMGEEVIFYIQVRRGDGCLWCCMHICVSMDAWLILLTLSQIHRNENTTTATARAATTRWTFCSTTSPPC